jgi:ABC-2 type transport system ATP-binding protein
MEASMNDPVITIDEVTKQFRGGARALDGLTLQIPRGSIWLLGPNGAGKTTLIRILATLLRPDTGTARIVASMDVPRKTLLTTVRSEIHGEMARVGARTPARSKVGNSCRLAGTRGAPAAATTGYRHNLVWSADTD